MVAYTSFKGNLLWQRICRSILSVLLFCSMLQDATSLSLRPSPDALSNKGMAERVPSRRRFLQDSLSSSLFVPISISATSGVLVAPESAEAISLFEKKDRRQLELCLVNLLRVQYWANSVAYSLEENNGIGEEKKKQAYLEARLGAKAIVAEKQKAGGGASLRVLTLKGLQIKETLDDLKYYAKSKKMDQYRDDLVESLASIVEFDGLETTQDPSPRSSLTLGMYNQQKATYVRRMLSERVSPLIEDIVGTFPDLKGQCEEYVVQYYPNELPPSPLKAVPQQVMKEESGQ